MKRYIHILHTNDIHSSLERTPQIATFVHQFRKKATVRGEEVVVVDVGDHMDRMRLETEGTYGRVNVDVMEATGYDVVTLGNNEGLTFSRDVLSHIYNETSFQVVLSNWVDIQTGACPSWMKPYVLRDVYGSRLAFVGLTAPFNAFYELLGWHIHAPIETMERLVTDLRTREGVQIVIVLSHLGYENDVRLAKEVPGIDVILGGHTHHLLEEGIQLGNTYIGAAGLFGDYVGCVTLAIDDNGTLMDVSGHCQPTLELPADEMVSNLIDTHRQEADNRLSKKVVNLKCDLPISWEGESPFGNLLADCLRATGETELAVVNSGQLLDHLSRGLVTHKDLHRICPSPINPCIMNIEGRFLLQALEESLLAEFQRRPIRGFGFRGKLLGSLAVSGMTITYRSSGRPYEKIAEVRIGNERLREDKQYRVAAIDMFTFGIGYPSLREGKDITFLLPHFLRDLLAKQMQDEAHIRQAFRQRWYPQR